MKEIILICFVIISLTISAQEIIESKEPVRVILYNGNEFIGRLISEDPREILILTEERGSVYIPQYEIKSLESVSKDEYNQNGDFIGEDVFSTRYFLSTNGLPVKKGEHYVQWNIYGPDFQFAVSDRLGVGLMTTWAALPIIANAKYSFKSRSKFNFAVGFLAGTGSWGAPSFAMALPFCTAGVGSRKSNLAISGGYGAFLINGDRINHAMTSFGALIKLNKKLSIVLDGFFVLPAKSTFHDGITYEWDPVSQTSVPKSYLWEEKHPGFSLIIPGLRWQTSSDKAFQFGFSGVYADGSFIEVPIPMVQWYRKL
jgi:hypothetical protein